MGLPGISDNEDEQTRLLRQLVALNGGDPDAGDTVTNNQTVNETVNNNQTVNETVNNTVNQYGSGAGSEGMFTTGPSGYTLEDTYETWDELEIGFPARTINIRASKPIYVAFNDPSNNPGRAIPITPEETPFTIGGSTPLNAEKVWLTLQKSDADPVEVHLIGF